MEVIRGQDNRVAGPVGPDYVVMTPIWMNRLATNIDLYADCAFIATINTAGVLSVTTMLHGTIEIGNTLFGVNVPSGISVSGELSGTGGLGTYQLSGTFGSISGSKMATGVIFATQKTEVCIQIDVYGPNSPDNVQIISTLFRDDVAIQQFTSLSPPPPPGWSEIPPGGTLSDPYDGVRPLYADDPVQLSEVFGEQQYEIRWKLDAYLQSNQIVTAPQQFLDTATIKTINVDVTYP